MSGLDTILTAVISTAFLLTKYIEKKYDNIHGINLQLNESYNDINKMAYAVLGELEKQGKKCEILELKEGHLTIIKVDEKRYKMMYKNDTTNGYEVQTIQLKLCK